MTNDEEIREVHSNYVSVTALDDEDEFAVRFWDGELLRTPAGHLVQSKNYRLLLHLVRELEEYPILKVRKGIIEEPRPLCTYLLFSTQSDFVAPGSTITNEQVATHLENDPVLHPSAGPEWTDQLRAWEPIREFLESIGAELHPRPGYTGEQWKLLVDALATRWNKLSEPGKAVVINLFTLTEGNLIASLAFASGACSEIEFGHSVLAASPLHFTFGWPVDEETTPEEAHSQAFRHFRDLGRVCKDYLAFFPTDSLALLVEQGEGELLEFKSTLRWDLRQEKKNHAITYASLKSISAFLNSKGGTLLIGVADDGSATGIELDQFPNEDRFLLHLYAVIKTSMGTDVTSLIKTDIDMYGGKKVCRVKVQPGTRPVYLKAKGKDEAFFIRTGPSSEQLGPRDLVNYISDRFPST